MISTQLLDSIHFIQIWFIFLLQIISRDLRKSQTIERNELIEGGAFGLYW